MEKRALGGTESSSISSVLGASTSAKAKAGRPNACSTPTSTDRKLRANRRVEDTPHYALRERLRFRFDRTVEAKAHYAASTPHVDTEKDTSRLNELRPNHIDIDRKLTIAHDKLSGDGYVY